MNDTVVSLRVVGTLDSLAGVSLDGETAFHIVPWKDAQYASIYLVYADDTLEPVADFAFSDYDTAAEARSAAEVQAVTLAAQYGVIAVIA